MKGGGREEVGKVAMSPLFPRLHVNDADKGGPRAPPRNKMALYEQFTIPSQRFARKPPAPAVPVPSTPGCGHDGAIFSSYYLPHRLSSTNKEVNSHSINSKHARNSIGSVEKKSIQNLPSVDSGSFPTQDKSSSRKRFNDEDDFRVPTFIHSKASLSSDKDQILIENSVGRKDSENGDGSTYDLLTQLLPEASRKPSEELAPPRLISKKRERDHSQERVQGTVRLKRTFDKSELPEKLARENAELCLPRVLTGKENMNIDMLVLEKSPKERSVCSARGSDGAIKCKIDSQKCAANYADTTKIESPRMQHKVQLSNDKGPVNAIEDVEKEADILVSQHRESVENAADSESSMLDSESVFSISPDEVARVMGVKHFWKARRVILNQQRVFAQQVFELHRLIKVQKLIAASPQILLEGDSFDVAGSVTAASKYSCETTEKSHLQIIEKDDSENAENGHVAESFEEPLSHHPLTESDKMDDSHKPDDSEDIVENSEEPSSSICERIMETSTVPPSFSLPNIEHEHDLNKCSAIQSAAGNGTHSGVSTASENSPNSWCFPQSVGGWLVPVLSPSEGLVYKPFTGSYPPAMGLLPTVFGGFGPLAMPPFTGDGMSHGFTASDQQNVAAFSGAPVISPSFYPVPYGFPFNPCASADVGQMNPFIDAQPKEQTGQSLGSSRPKLDAFFASSKFAQASRGSDMQGSSASSNNERLHKAMDLSAQINRHTQITNGSCRSSQSPGTEQQTRVIKVVPHNARRATESAARIFKCIQRERELCESV